MTRPIPTSLDTSTDIIEHALLHARQETWHCEQCDETGDIGHAELELALESRLVNARALIQAVHDPHDSTALMRALSTLDYLIREALQLCTLTHWADKDIQFPLPSDEINRPPLRETFRSIANHENWAPAVAHGA